MAQTTGHMTGKDLTIQVSTDDSTWTDIGGSSSSVSPDGGARGTGSAHTFATALPLIGIGPKEPVTLTLRMVYTETDSEAVDLVDGYFDNGTLIYLRYRPTGDVGSGGWQFHGHGYFTKPIAPAVDADSSDILSVETEWFGVELEKEAQTS